MKVAAIIQQVRRWGGDLQIQGSGLLLSAAQPLPTALVQEVRKHKDEILKLLCSEETFNTNFVRIEKDIDGKVWLVASGSKQGSDGVLCETRFSLKLRPRERGQLSVSAKGAQ